MPHTARSLLITFSVILGVPAYAATLSHCERELLDAKQRNRSLTLEELSEDSFSSRLLKVIRPDLVQDYSDSLTAAIESISQPFHREIAGIKRRYPRGSGLGLRPLKEATRAYVAKVLDAYIDCFGRTAEKQRCVAEPEIAGLAEEQNFEASLPYKHQYNRYWQAHAALDAVKNAEALAKARRDFPRWLVEIKHPLHAWDLFSTWNESERQEVMTAVGPTDPQGAAEYARVFQTIRSAHRSPLHLVETPEPLIRLFPWQESQITMALFREMIQTVDRQDVLEAVRRMSVLNRAWQRAFFTAAVNGPHATAFVPNRSRFGNLLVVLDGYQLAFFYRPEVTVPAVEAKFYSEDELVRMLPERPTQAAPEVATPRLPPVLGEKPRPASLPDASLAAAPVSSPSTSSEEGALQSAAVWAELDPSTQTYFLERVREHPQRLALILSFADRVAHAQIEPDFLPPLKNYFKRLLLMAEASDSKLLSNLEARLTSLRYHFQATLNQARRGHG